MKLMSVRLARAVRFTAGANGAQAFGHDAQAWAKYQCRSDGKQFSYAVRKLPFFGNRASPLFPIQFEVCICGFSQSLEFQSFNFLDG
jgi:hypothetical protein